MKKRVFVIFTLLFVALFWGGYRAQAQTFEEWKKQREKEMQQFKDDREKQLAQLANEFDDFVKKRDQEYAGYLKEQWKKFRVMQGLEVPEEPKPEEPPVYVKPERIEPPRALPVAKPTVPEIPDIVPQPILPRITKQEPDDFPQLSADFDFYGFPVVLGYDENLKKPGATQMNEQTISAWFTEMSKTNYNNLIEQLNYYREQMNLNDWGYYLLVKNTASNIAIQANDAKLLTWFLLIRSGYKVKAAYFENQVYVLLPIRNQVYGKNFFTFDNLNFYMMEGDLANIYTYEKDFPDAQRIMDLNMYSPLSIGDKTETKILTFDFNKPDEPVKVNYNVNLINFYKDYPLSDLKVYFDATLSPESKYSIASSLAPMLEGKSEIEATNMLLNFVQTAFQYQTDQDQFGYEKFFFAEEAFHYPYCDCEDRSVLFSYLAKSLLNLDVIGLNYPGHVATAVCFNSDVPGDFINYDGKKWVIADPTYINAPVGLTMPEYVGVKAEIIPLINPLGESRKKEMIWQEIIAAGGNRGDISRDIVIDNDGNSALAGFFTGDFKFDDMSVSATGTPQMFTMMLNEKKNVKWFSTSTGEGFAMAHGILKDAGGDVYVSGTFKGEMKIASSTLKTSDASDVFLAKYAPDGKLQWLQKAGIDTMNQENFLNFVVKFDRLGKNLGNDLFFETGDFDNYGLSLNDAGEILIAGSFNKTTGMNMKELSTNESGTFSAIDALKKENDRLIDESYEKTIAGLFAVVNLIKTSGVAIPGKDAQKVLDVNNPKFKEQSPNIYKTIGKILFLKNSDGVVTIKTDDGKDVYFDMMRICTDSKIKVSFLKTGDARIDMLSGIKVGKAFIWYNLNYVVMYKANGDLLFDYDSDHTQKSMNLRRDILY